MTRAEIAAFNEGVTAVLDLARATSDALVPRITEKPTRFNYAIGALDGLADEGEALLLPLPATSPSVPIPVQFALPAPVASAPIAARRLEAQAQGYTGEACTDCGNFTLTRNGTCLKCDTCGANSGCS